ncbi:hypothetical protein CLV99_3901 [Sphingobacterium yanglingense]|uniref:Uncharacterized protein n=1 Tax=Sphingobacterium yanglingense TaxID=1437280 RepID=A0A4V3DD85_9SPHI|nr:hypothetical protein CLV99_3901 [Sphingobacterium yanglingense]
MNESIIKGKGASVAVLAPSVVAGESRQKNLYKCS